MDLKECEVCGDERDVSRHYGVACCYGCKAFFRRTIFEKKKYVCKEGKNCKMTKANRNRCRYCRFEKCLKVGMSEDNFREPYSTSKPVEAPSDSPTTNPLASPSTSCLPPLLPGKMSKESENLITFLKSMTRSTIDTCDPAYDNLSLEECQNLPINRKLNLSDALKHPSMVVAKTKFHIEYVNNSNMAYGWYLIFVYVAEWAKGIPQFRMLKPIDQEVLFHLNFVNLSIPLCLYYMIDDPKKYEEIESCDNYIRPDAFGSEVILTMGKKLINIYKTHLIEPFLEVNPDEDEVALGTTILLFQFSESLSAEGHLICKKYKEKLYNALYEYQMFKFPDKTELQRIQRYSLLTELMHRVTKVWSEECEFHLLLSTFNEMNIDGLLKELLFTKCLTKHSKS